MDDHGPAGAEPASNGGGHLCAGWDTAVWNNDGDKAVLKSSGGEVIDRCRYAGGGVTASC